jgi:hypothetical protein
MAVKRGKNISTWKGKNQRNIRTQDRMVWTQDITLHRPMHSSSTATYMQVFFMAQQTLVRPGLLSVEASRSHTDPPHSVGLLGSSTRRRDLYLTTHNTHKTQTSMPSAGFEPAIPASQRPQKHALDRAPLGSALYEYKVKVPRNRPVGPQGGGG